MVSMSEDILGPLLPFINSLGILWFRFWFGFFFSFQDLKFEILKF